MSERNKADRKKGPHIAGLPPVDLPEYKKYFLDNGLEVYELAGGAPGVCKLDVVFSGGRPFEKKASLSRACTFLTKEGTTTLNSTELAEYFDYYGSTLSTFSTLDHCGMSLFTLSRYFELILPQFVSTLKDSVFPEEEIRKFKKNAKKKLKEDMSQNDIVAFRHLTEQLYGSRHPYGYNSTAASIDAITRADLTDHYSATYTGANGFVVVSGDLPGNCASLLNTYLGAIKKQKVLVPQLPPVAENVPAVLKIQGANELQASIRIGKRIPGRRHEDYPGLILLDQILGGYFGSRLMSNIREDKGLTYNIYSTVELMRYDAYWMIATETSVGNVSPAMAEIRNEMEALVSHPVSLKELDMARNYLLGNLVTSLDSVFSIASMLRNLKCEGGDFGLLDEIIRKIRQITPADISYLSGKYLSPDSFHIVIVEP